MNILQRILLAVDCPKLKLFRKAFYMRQKNLEEATQLELNFLGEALTEGLQVEPPDDLSQLAKELWEATEEDWVIEASHIFTEPLMAEASIYPELAYSPRYRVQGATVNEAVDAAIVVAWREWIDGDVDMTKRNDSIWPLLKQRWSIIEDEDES